MWMRASANLMTQQSRRQKALFSVRHDYNNSYPRPSGKVEQEAVIQLPDTRLIRKRKREARRVHCRHTRSYAVGRRASSLVLIWWMMRPGWLWR